MRDVYIHIGLHKTATTFLQNNFFPLLTKEISYIHPSKFIQPVRDIATLDEIKFPYDDIRAEIESRHEKNKPILISSENLSGHPGLKYINRSQIIGRLKILYPNCKIIIGLREQWSLISSMYKLYVQNGGTKAISDYIYNKEKIYNESYFGVYNRISLDTFNYVPILDLLYSTFDEENVFIFNFKDFTESPEYELTRLSNFINTSIILKEINYKKVNSSISWDLVDSFRRANQLCKSYYHEGGIFLSNQKVHRFLRRYYKLKFKKNIAYTEFSLLKESDYFKNDLRILSEKYCVDLK